MTDQDDARELFGRATEAYHGAQYEQAADLFVELLLHPGFPADSMREVEWNLGMCYFRLGNAALGRQHMEAGGYSEHDYRDALGDVRTQQAQEVFARATAAYQGAQYEQAADLFAELLIDPGLPADSMREIHWNLGMCYFRLGNAELGRQHMEAGAYSEPDYRDALGDMHSQQAQDVFARATAAYQGGQYEQAADLFAEVLIEPGLAADSMREIHWNLGMCYFRLGNEQLGHEHMAAGGYRESDYADALRDLHADAGN